MDESDDYLNSGITAYESGDYILALDDFNKAIELNSNSAQVYYYRGCVYSAFEYTEQSIIEFTKAININPEYADAYYERGKMKYDINDIDGAKEDMKMAKDLKPSLKDWLSDEYH